MKMALVAEKTGRTVPLRPESKRSAEPKMSESDLAIPSKDLTAANTATRR